MDAILAARIQMRIVASLMPTLGLHGSPSCLGALQTRDQRLMRRLLRIAEDAERNPAANLPEQTGTTAAYAAASLSADWAEPAKR